MSKEADDLGQSVRAADAAIETRRALHWYDFLCPFCYVGEQRSTILECHSFDVVDLPFQAHPDIALEGRPIGARHGPVYDLIEEEAKALGLPLVWPNRLPNFRRALAAAEWCRRQAPQSFTELKKSLFTAHFALGEDLGDPTVVERYAAQAGVDVIPLRGALNDGSAVSMVEQSETLGRGVGVLGTPAWLVSGRLISSLYPPDEFERLARAAGS